MKDRLSSLISALLLITGTALSSVAATPLTKAEETVCRNLNHCLKIVDEHPMDSYDYAVLADEFRRFGDKGRDSLLRRLRKGGVEAGHAADLLAMTRDTTVLAPLKALGSHKDETVQMLAIRTHDALETRLKAKEIARLPSRPIEPVSATSPCPSAEPVSPAAQRREMPFFESKIAHPDRFGAYRPSAPFRVELQRTERSNLMSAVSVPGGWLAGYQGGLIRYDNETGRPEVLSDAVVISLQRRKPSDFASGVWAIFETPDGLIISDPSADRTMARLNGQLTGLARTQADDLVLSTSSNVTLRLSPDGELATGCKDAE